MKGTGSKEPIGPGAIRKFRRTIYEHYHKEGRVFPWRSTDNPYEIFVSEMMLQQTPVERALQKYEQFLVRFPDFPSLASASLSEILSMWQGLGYNRRALAIRAVARVTGSQFSGQLPPSVDELARLPGIGRTTASAVCAFAFNQPVLFIETNIRAVYLDRFFQDREAVRDSEIFPFLELTLDKDNPREWYYALMDYGAMLKKKGRVPNSRSSAYRKQPPFKGSDRQIRGTIIKLLIAYPGISQDEIAEQTGMETARVKWNLHRLLEEGFIRKIDDTWFLA
jgi:A/G-specific adenine glycosylase